MLREISANGKPFILIGVFFDFASALDQAANNGW
jgi:hypothetical protein